MLKIVFKRTFLFLIIIFVLIFLFKVIKLNFVKYDESNFLTDKKILTVYYSHGTNTEHIAKTLHNIVGGDIQKINVIDKYPDSFIKTFSLVQKQLKENYIPKIEDIDVSNYDIIFIGSPIWAGKVSLPMKSFLKNNDFNNKLIVPFVSYLGDAKREKVKSDIDEIIEESSENTKVLKPMLTFRGGIVLLNKQIENWLNSLSNE